MKFKKLSKSIKLKKLNISRNNRFVVIPFVLVFAGLAASLLPNLFAATSIVRTEAETGQLSGNVIVKNDTNASSGQAIEFGSTQVNRLVGWKSLYKSANGYGPRLDNTSVLGPWWGRRTNSLKNPAFVKSAMIQAIKASTDQWNQMKANGTLHPSKIDLGPRAETSYWLSYTGSKNSKGENAVPSLLDMGRVANGKYDAELLDAWRAVKDLNYGGYNDWPARLLNNIAHENNLPSSTHYSGISPILVGDTRLLNATEAEYGATVARLLRNIATPTDSTRKLVDGYGGNRGPLFRYTYSRMVNLARTVDSRFIFNWVWTNAAAAQGDIPTVSEAALNMTALPEPSAGLVDAIGGDVYGRGSGPKYLGGPVGEFSSWDMSTVSNIFETFADLSREYNIPLSFTELGVYYQLPIGYKYTAPNQGNPYEVTVTSLHPDAFTDDQSVIWWKYVFNFMETHDVTWWTMWNANGDKPDNIAYYPVNATYPKTQALWASKFPKPPGGRY